MIDPLAASIPIPRAAGSPPAIEPGGPGNVPVFAGDFAALLTGLLPPAPPGPAAAPIRLVKAVATEGRQGLAAPGAPLPVVGDASLPTDGPDVMRPLRVDRPKATAPVVANDCMCEPEPPALPETSLLPVESDAPPIPPDAQADDLPEARLEPALAWLLPPVAPSPPPVPVTGEVAEPVPTPTIAVPAGTARPDNVALRPVVPNMVTVTPDISSDAAVAVPVERIKPGRLLQTSALVASPVIAAAPTVAAPPEVRTVRVAATGRTVAVDRTVVPASPQTFAGPDEPIPVVPRRPAAGSSPVPNPRPASDPRQTPDPRPAAIAAPVRAQPAAATSVPVTSVAALPDPAASAVAAPGLAAPAPTGPKAADVAAVAPVATPGEAAPASPRPSPDCAPVARTAVDRTAPVPRFAPVDQADAPVRATRPVPATLATPAAPPEPRRAAEPLAATLTAPATATAAPLAVAPAGDAAQAGIDLTRDPGLHRMIDRIETLRDAADATDTRIRLIPDKLGPVDVAVRREGEAVHVHFTAPEATTRQLIADAQPRLTELAEARGIRIERATVDAGIGSGPGTGGEQRQPQTQPAPRFTTNRLAATAPADEDSTDQRIA